MNPIDLHYAGFHAGLRGDPPDPEHIDHVYYMMAYNDGLEEARRRQIVGGESATDWRVAA